MRWLNSRACRGSGRVITAASWPIRRGGIAGEGRANPWAGCACGGKFSGLRGRASSGSVANPTASCGRSSKRSEHRPAVSPRLYRGVERHRRSIRAPPSGLGPGGTGCRQCLPTFRTDRRRTDRISTVRATTASVNGSITIADAGRFTQRRSPVAPLVAIHIPDSRSRNPGVGRNHKKDIGRAFGGYRAARSTTAHKLSSPPTQTAPC